MDPVEIRPAVQQDAEAAAALWLWSRREALGLIPAPVHSDAEVRGWMASHVLAQLECWVAETIDGTIVGLLVLEEDWVDQLYVLPGWQGQGVGSQLLGFAKRLRPHGLQLWTFASNTPARRFYEQRGFVAAEMTDGTDNEERTPDVRYVWESEDQHRS
jgi:GNAT superfamily N-acetyltransferase